MTGPVKAPGGPPITAQNAAGLFGDEVYTRIPDLDERNRYVQGVLQAVFQRLTTSDVDVLRW
ncbi:hypothetical protein GCM10025868_14440 [Angustibacter aerolatus]|uniref:Uncharacterized protein n=1 Tax=Angustibacter aerolatus TaxID=1162965 RepID=A0ABQ6JGB8_9ACTN|nr:hypothetical protein [Angustibacter aerolatus]GMA86194.1 hypothetical protein GCM10025868_14440 [Angustibacter aerolatus]